MKNIIYPNYNCCILNTIATVMKYYGLPCEYTVLPELEAALAKKYKTIVLMVFDGMGIDALEKNLKPTDFLNQHIKSELTSVVPSTTTAAMTAYYAGKSPLEHGWLGWSLYFKEYGRYIDTFINTDSHTGEKLELPHAGHERPGGDERAPGRRPFAQGPHSHDVRRGGRHPARAGRRRARGQIGRAHV